MLAHWHTGTLAHWHTGTETPTLKTHTWQTGKASIDGWTHLLILDTIVGTGHDSRGRLSRLTIRTFEKFLEIHLIRMGEGTLPILRK